MINLYFRNDIADYVDHLNDIYKTNIATEHSYRPALKGLLETILNQGKKKEKNRIKVINEPTRKDYGAPDFEFRCDDIAISFLETKKPGDTDLLGLNSKKHKEQFDRYKRAVKTIVFTDFIHFHLFEDGEQTLFASLGEINNNEIIFNDDEQQLSCFEKIVDTLSHAEPQPIRSAKMLAQTMATKAKIIADILHKAMMINASYEDKELHNKMDAFKKFLVHDMSPEQFTDFYAQTVVYGLFAARVQDKTIKQSFSLQQAADLIPDINPFLKKIFKLLALAYLHNGVKWIVEDLVSVFRVTDMKRVLRCYGKDPLVHFYEDFLEEYNPKIREDFGVWYTPEKVVNFIVNTVDFILKDQLNIEHGLADNTLTSRGDKTFHKVQILDPATGTGTFLAATAEKIHDNYTGQEGLWPEDVVKHIIPRLNGFEYLMAPYTMAHLKVAKSLRLDEVKTELPERLHIYLTNSLEEDHPEATLDFARFITDESNAASTIKRDTPVMVVMGNPPYNEKSANKGEWIMGLMDDYKQEPGQEKKEEGRVKKKHKNTLEEKNSKAINNDYCKFIRLGQNFVEHTNEGVLAYICGNTFLDTPVFRGMRYELMRKFDEIYIINLHGSSKRNENDNGLRDENVFNIKVGVSINIFVKHKDDNDEFAKVFYKDVYGTRSEKLQYLSQNDFAVIDFIELSPQAPLYTFRTRDNQLRKRYDTGFNIKGLMKKNVQGFKTDKDYVALQYDREEIVTIAQSMFSNASDDQLREAFGFHDNRDWSLNRGRGLLKKENNWERFITQVQYRPFDLRWTLFHKALITYPRPLQEASVFDRENTVLCLGRTGSAIGDNEWSLAYISELPTDINMIPRGGVYLFPLFYYDDQTRNTNFAPNAIKKIEQSIGKQLQSPYDEMRHDSGFLAIDLLDYIYAILHSRRYRSTYHECLQDSFPTIPYPSSASYFFKMAELGSRLRALHLLKEIHKEDFMTSFPVIGDNVCKCRSFEETELGWGRVWINDKQYFDHIPQAAWEQIVSGYQPLDRWLKDRKDKKLTNEEIIHYQKIVVALHQQSTIMELIDQIFEL